MWRRDMRTVTPKERRSSTTVRFRATKRSGMPVRSLNSSVLVWPNRAQVDRAVRDWANRIVAEHRDVRRLGYFGSYARGDRGVGSDLALIAGVGQSREARDRRAIVLGSSALPVTGALCGE